jgi:hypothetical protein
MCGPAKIYCIHILSVDNRVKLVLASHSPVDELAVTGINHLKLANVNQVFFMWKSVKI